MKLSIIVITIKKNLKLITNKIIKKNLKLITNKIIKKKIKMIEYIIKIDYFFIKLKSL